jgi:hypothetical protein
MGKTGHIGRIEIGRVGPSILVSACDALQAGEVYIFLHEIKDDHEPENERSEENHETI